MAERICATPGCGGRLATHNQSGYCTPCGDRQAGARWRARQAGRPEPFGPPPPRRTCAEPGCAAPLRRNNRQGYCPRHVYRPHPRPRPGAPAPCAAPALVARVAVHPPPAAPYPRPPYDPPIYPHPGPPPPRPAYDWDALTPGDLLSADQEIALGQLWAAGGAGRAVAERVFIAQNQGLVAKLAQHYQHRGLEWDDLMQWGNLGLLQAVRRWDWRRGYRFSTYAVNWIRQHITRAVEDQGRTIRLPVHVYQDLAQVAYAAAKLEADAGRGPSDAAVAAVLGKPEAWVAARRQWGARPLSLDASISAEEPVARGLFVVDPAAPDPGEVAAAGALRAEIARLLDLAGLSARERFVISARYGLLDETNRAWTLQEVGERLDISRERARQIEQAVLTLLRRVARHPASGLAAVWEELVA